MHPFFEMVERSGIVQKRLAALMGISQEHFSKVKAGKVPATAKFQRQAVNALTLLGFRRPDGLPYEIADLFFSSVVSERSSLEAGVA